MYVGCVSVSLSVCMPTVLFINQTFCKTREDEQIVFLKGTWPVSVDGNTVAHYVFDPVTKKVQKHFEQVLNDSCPFL